MVFRKTPRKALLLQNLLWLLLFVFLQLLEIIRDVPVTTDNAGGSTTVELGNVIGPYALPYLAQVRAYAREEQNQRVVGSSIQADSPETLDVPHTQQNYQVESFLGQPQPPQSVTG